jgi:hypothetical protein
MGFAAAFPAIAEGLFVGCIYCPLMPQDMTGVFCAAQYNLAPVFAVLHKPYVW